MSVRATTRSSSAPGSSAPAPYELAKRGWRTLNLDKLPAAGYGSTGASCAIIRTHYSTLDGAALAYESYFAWDDWAGYLAVPTSAAWRSS